MNLKGFGRKRSWPDRSNILAFSWRTEETTITGIPAQIRTEYLPNTSPEPYRYVNPLGKMR
jgi:hypothetical protein